MKRHIENSRILITGGAGFIGSNLAEKLLGQNNKVTVFDNFSTGKRENLRLFEQNPNFRLIEGDIRDLEICREVVRDVDCVLHEAALGSVPRSVKDPMTSTAVNILGFVNMLYAAQEAKIRRFVYASSSSVYGNSPVLPKTEDAIGKPLSPYAITKYADELFAENFHELYGIDTVGLRFFNVFGRRQDPAGAYAAVIPKFMQCLMHHERPVINGDGSFSRDFTYVENVVQVHELALLAENPEALNQVYNVAFGERTSLNELFAYLREELSAFDPEISLIEPVYSAERPGDVPHSLADIGKAEKLLGYTPEYSVREGLKRAAAWYWSNLK